MALIAVLSTRFTEQPQKGAAVPALFMGLGGVLLLAFDSPMHGAPSRVWPPAVLVLAVWMILRAHRQLRSRSGRFLIYPVIAILILASLGGGYKTCAAWRMQRPLQHRVS
jgi:hypothetical protein